ncbi:MAG: vitamin B12 ABC transporter permease BtuC [Halobacteriales archaeon]|nr:vitamin B12 ABC transporter permease BtuC [Halobacteriales archaeon]
MYARSRLTGWCLSLSAVLVAVVAFAATVGPVDIRAGAVAVILLDTAYGAVADLLRLPSKRLFEGPDEYRTIVVGVRMPRIAVAATVGFALGASGAVMQGFFRNPMADPSIIGVSSGAAVGAVAVISLPLSVPFGIQGAAFVGALVAAFTVYGIATANGRTGVATLLLAGVAVQTFLGAVVSLMLYVSDDDSMREAVYWLMGYLVHRDWSHVAVSLPVVVVGTGAMFAYARDLNLLLLGEEEAHTLGVEPQRTKRVLLAVSSVTTAAAVAVAGIIGFVGLVVPHGMRLVVGPDHRVLIPTSALAGAVFLVLADNSARHALGGTELPVGIVTAFVGVPFFLYLLRTREVHEL